MPHERSSFRPDVEGLRGVAILLVVLFHAGLPALAGGFVGVDVFFVLSGYFISALLVREWSRSGELNLGEFYGRRALRPDVRPRSVRRGDASRAHHGHCALRGGHDVQPSSR